MDLTEFKAIARRFLRNRLALLGLIIVVALILTAIFANWIMPHDPTLQELADKRMPPGGKYLLGADEFGRDLLSRLILGSRVALLVANFAVGIALICGIVLGGIAGYFGGLVDQAIMTVADILLAFPYLLLALGLVTVLGPGLVNTSIAVGVWATPTFTRVVRSAVLSIKHREYIQAAHAIGTPTVRIMWRHILPNFVSPIIVYGTLYMANAIMMEAALSFLGLGVQPPQPSWGSMIAAGRNYLQIAPHMATIPGLAIMVTVLGFNFVGDGLRDALDPKLKDRIRR